MAPTLVKLPNEIISGILKYVASPPDVDDILRGNPEDVYRGLDLATVSNLKNASLVCHHWRRLALPILFRNVIWSFERLYKPSGNQDLVSQIEVLDFLRCNKLTPHVEHFTILIDPPPGCGGERISGDQCWGVLPEKPNMQRILVIHKALQARGLRVSEGDQVHASDEEDEVNESDEEFEVNESDAEDEDDYAMPDVMIPNWNNNWLWEAIFSCLDPLRITFVGPKDVLASLLGRSVCRTTDEINRARLHLFSLSRDTHSPEATPLPMASNAWYLPIGLFGIRPWTSLLINDGIPYLESDRIDRRGRDISPKEMFPFLFPMLFNSVDPAMKQLYSQVKSITYVTICTTQAFLHDLISCCPPVETLRCRFTPCGNGRTQSPYENGPEYLMHEDWQYDTRVFWWYFFGCCEDNQCPRSLRKIQVDDEMMEDDWNKTVTQVLRYLGGYWEVDSKGVMVRDDQAAKRLETGMWPDIFLHPAERLTARTGNLETPPCLRGGIAAAIDLPDLSVDKFPLQKNTWEGFHAIRWWSD